MSAMNECRLKFGKALKLRPAA